MKSNYLDLITGLVGQVGVPTSRYPSLSSPFLFSQEQKSWFTVFYQELAKLGTTGSASQLSGGPVMPDLVPRTAAEDRWSAERYVEVRLACAYNLPAMLLFVGPAHFTDQLFASFCDLATDPSPGVRKTLAAGLHELIKIIGRLFTSSHTITVPVPSYVR